VTLHVATASDASLLGNLLELYIHDLSEIFPVEMNAEGRFGYPDLPRYWSEAGNRHAFLIRSGARLAGFALVTRGSPATASSEDLDLAEFFVLRAHRRTGVGRRAANALWDRLPGQWIVRVSESHSAGLVFWERVIKKYTHGTFSTGAHRGRHHLFKVFSFRSGTANATR
jgi:predicted acetyltransferase